MVSVTVWGWILHPAWGAVVPIRVAIPVTAMPRVAAAKSVVLTMQQSAKFNSNTLREHVLVKLKIV